MIIIEEKATTKVPGITSLYVKFDMNNEVLKIIQNLDCRYYDPKTHIWEIPITYLSELIDKLNEFDDIDLKLYNEQPKSLKKYKLADYKTQPYNHQIEGIQYGLNHKNWLLTDPPGMGKTLLVTYLAEELYDRGKINHCLIVCGIKSLNKNWVKEIKRHSKLDVTLLGQKVQKSGKIVVGSIADRQNHLKKKIPEFFIITNIETLRDDNIIKLINKGANKIDMIVIDEIHKCKNGSSKQGRNLLKANKAEYKIGMSGTLLLNEPLDAYVPLKWIGVEKSNQSTFKTCYYKYEGRFHNIFVGYRNLDILKDQLAQYSLRRPVDLLGLPEQTIIPEYIEMDDDQAHFYENIKQGIIDEVDKVKINTTTCLAMVTRLRQATACPFILTTESISAIKINRALELIEEILGNNEKVVVFSTFKETLYQLQKNITNHKTLLATGDQSDNEISDAQDIFQSDKEHCIFLATWQQCGTGLTLTAARYVIFLDTPWTYGVFDQACRRIQRIGTKQPTFVYNLIVKDTIDERVSEILTDKQAIADYVIDDTLSEKNIQSLKKYIQELS